MAKKDLIPKDLSKRPDHKDIARRGGQAKTPSKVLASRINGMLSSKKISKQKKAMLLMLQRGNLRGLVDELIGWNLEGAHREDRRDKVIEQVTKIMPNKNINLEMEVKDDQDIVTSEDFANAFEEFKRKKHGEKRETV